LGKINLSKAKDVALIYALSRWSTHRVANCLCVAPKSGARLHQYFGGAHRPIAVESRWAMRPTLKKQFREIKVLSENDGVVFMRPHHNILIKGVGTTELAPMLSSMSVLAQIFHPW
jgi:hypothetical protein